MQFLLSVGCHKICRFVAQSKYVLTGVLVGHQMKLPPSKLKKLRTLAIYVGLYHIPYFLACPLAVSAPYNDLQFMLQVRSLLNQKGQEEIAGAVLKSLKGQVWLNLIGSHNV